VLQAWLEALLAPAGGAAAAHTLNATAGMAEAEAEAEARAPASVVAAVSIFCTSVIMVARPLSGALYDRVGPRRFLTGLQLAQLAVHALLVAQQATRIGGLWLPPLLISCLFGCFAAAVTSWAPLTLDLLRRAEALPTMLIALPAAQALSAALMGLLMDVHAAALSDAPSTEAPAETPAERSEAVFAASAAGAAELTTAGAALGALQSFAAIMAALHALSLALAGRLLLLCARSSSEGVGGPLRARRTEQSAGGALRQQEEAAGRGETELTAAAEGSGPKAPSRGASCARAAAAVQADVVTESDVATVRTLRV